MHSLQTSAKLHLVRGTMTTMLAILSTMLAIVSTSWAGHVTCGQGVRIGGGEGGTISIQHGELDRQRSFEKEAQETLK